MTSGESLQTIESFLSVDDWQYSLSLKQGSHNNYFWLRSKDLRVIDCLDLVDLPDKKCSVLVTEWDSSDVCEIYGRKQGWRCVGRYALSEPSLELPALQLGADCAQMLIDHEVSDNDILAADFTDDEPYFLDDLIDDRAIKFWSAIEQVDPYCYFSYGYPEEFTFIARTAAVYDAFFKRIDFATVEANFRKTESVRRSQLWKALGPECGPEVCIEENCDRLRIQLAVRCFIHQIFSR